MASLHITGNLVEDPTERKTGSGDPVVNFAVAATERQYDRQAGEWKDGETLFLRCVIYREAAVNFARSARKGTRVLVVGRLKPNDYEKDGVRRYGFVLEADEVGLATRFAAYQRVESAPAGASSGRRAAEVPSDGRPF